MNRRSLLTTLTLLLAPIRCLQVNTRGASPKRQLFWYEVQNYIKFEDGSVEDKETNIIHVEEPLPDYQLNQSWKYSEWDYSKSPQERNGMWHRITTPIPPHKPSIDEEKNYLKEQIIDLQSHLSYWESVAVD